MRMDWVKEQAAICARCGYCKPVCPVYRVRGWESNTPRTKLFIAGEDSIPKEDISRIFECTLCGRCNVACQVDINVTRVCTDLRKKYRSIGPEGVGRLEAALKEKHNVLNQDNTERLRWTRRLKDVEIKKDGGRIAYFAGCSAALFPALNSIPQSFVKILENVREDYVILGDREWCCGLPLIALGMPDVAEEFIVHNVELINSLGVESVVVTCPGCFKVFKHDYRDIAGDLIDFEVLHSTEYILGLMDWDKISPKKFESKITYHDPCALGRGGGVFEEPRRILENIPGISFTELYENKRDCNCCGGGGSLMAINPGLSYDITQNKVAEINSIGVDNVVSACQTCKKNIQECARREKASFKALDIVELVAGLI